MDKSELTDSSCDIYDAGHFESALFSYTHKDGSAYGEYGDVTTHTEVHDASSVPAEIAGQLALNSTLTVDVSGFETANGSMMDKLRNPQLQAHPWYTRGLQFRLSGQADLDDEVVSSLTYFSVRHDTHPPGWPLVVKLALTLQQERTLSTTGSNVRALRPQWSPAGVRYTELVNGGIADRSTIATAIEVNHITEFLRTQTRSER